MPEDKLNPLNPVLTTLLAAAFTAWASVVLWFGNAINERLSDLQATMQEVQTEMVDFKVSVTERVTRVETRVEHNHRGLPNGEASQGN